MKIVSNREIIDVVKYTQDKIILVEKLPLLESTQYKVNYFILDLKTQEKEVITKSAYLLKKFGTPYQAISEALSGYVQCEAYTLKNRSVFTIFPNGQCGLFNSEGKIEWSKDLQYNESPVTSLAPDGDYIWCVCKEENCVIRYACDNFQVDLRIGSKDAATFDAPCFASADEENVYICCATRLRAISKQDFTVRDIPVGIPSLQKFYRFGAYSLLCTAEGTYLTEEV